MFETGLSMLINVASNVLISGQDARRFGNGHPNIVPYRTFLTAEQYIALAGGEDWRGWGGGSAHMTKQDQGILAEGGAELGGMERPRVAGPDLPNRRRAGNAGGIRRCLSWKN